MSLEALPKVNRYRLIQPRETANRLARINAYTLMPLSSANIATIAAVRWEGSSSPWVRLYMLAGSASANSIS